MHVQGSTIHNHPKVETTQMSIDGGMDKQNVACPYRGILFYRNQNEVLTHAHYSVDGLKTLHSGKEAGHKKATYCRIPFI